MSIKLTLKRTADFTGLVISPALAPETLSPETAGKEAGEVRAVNGKTLLSLGAQKKLSAEMIRRAGGGLAKWLVKNNVTEASLELGPLFGLGLAISSVVNALVEGILLGAFTFVNHKTVEEEKRDTALSLLVDGAAGASESEIEVSSEKQRSLPKQSISRVNGHMNRPTSSTR